MIRLFLANLLGLALLFSGCATTKEVKKIINESNSAMLVANIGSITNELPKAGSTHDEMKRAIAQLDAFLQQHPDNPIILNQLRLRIALLHLYQGSSNLAKIAFKGVDSNYLVAPRDIKLYEIYPTMIWWWENAESENFTNQRSNAKNHQQKLLTAAQDPEIPSELKDYLLEMRAWIGIKLAIEMPISDQSKILEDAINTLTQSFEGAEKNLLSPSEEEINNKNVLTKEDLLIAKAYDKSVRRFLRVQGLLDSIATAMKRRNPENRLNLNFQVKEINDYYKNKIISP